MTCTISPRALSSSTRRGNLTFQGHQGLGFVPPQGFEHDAPLGAVELQLPAFAGAIFLQAGVYLRLDRFDLGAYGRLAHGQNSRRTDYPGAALTWRLRDWIYALRN